jgi:hypothetical protein
VQKLRSSQAAVRLTTPDPSEVRNAYEKLTNAKEATPALYSTNVASKLVGTVDPTTSRQIQLLLTIVEEFDVCVALFGS